MELNLDRLEPGQSSLELEGELSLSGQPESGSVHVSGTLVVDAMDQRVLIRGGFEAIRAMECDRCARPLRRSTDAEIDMMILRNPSRAGEPEDSDDAWVVQQQRGVVSLDEALLEAVLLAGPQQVLCQEDCRGLCPRCGTDLNESGCDCPTEEIDSRWAKLKQLKDETES